MLMKKKSIRHSWVNHKVHSYAIILKRNKFLPIIC